MDRKRCVFVWRVVTAIETGIVHVGMRVMIVERWYILVESGDHG